MDYVSRWWYNKLVMDQLKSQTLLRTFFSVFKQSIHTVGRHIYLILFPLGLDLFLLLGPRLGLSKILNPLLASLPAIDNFEQQFNLSWDTFISSTMESVKQFNLFSALRTLPFGLPSIMSSRLGTASPFGISQQLELANFGDALLAFLLFSLIGVFAGTVYFTLMANAVQKDTHIDNKPSTSIFFSFLNLSAFNLSTWTLALLLLIPAVVVLGLLLGLNLGLGYLAYMLIFIVLLSFVMPLVFTPILVIAERLNFIKAAVRSQIFTRKTGILASFFIVLSITVSYLTNMLWNSAPNTSPFVLIGIFGHALVTTLLLTSSFHFLNVFETVDISQKPLII